MCTHCTSREASGSLSESSSVSCAWTICCSSSPSENAKASTNCTWTKTRSALSKQRTHNPYLCQSHIGDIYFANRIKETARRVKERHKIGSKWVLFQGNWNKRNSVNPLRYHPQTGNKLVTFLYFNLFFRTGNVAFHGNTTRPLLYNNAYLKTCPGKGKYWGVPVFSNIYILKF